ncbi:Putative flippase GtrA (transmembrane translocase of bactoprenol-linked glucose) [Butyrivibrio fibrisolvens]|uniref:Putative flippase GtrA (Transmembrane translocase of bactoprenol-linked glucose) n=1 Tax=Butyrivibrio fibrisolvens TaxID=831 RepID=A0A1H9Q9V8_BUTFI|nr:GtrA family protein [Butyrivibrio fibrisolvens]SER57301.1 Putative flippase GtrA (transmembrane translocase of bactoprenol-linked glucose) [Butyrivibrio fibrisolvens]
MVALEQKKDIFDRIMSLPVLNIFEPFYKKHKEGLLYLFFGGLAFFLSIFLYWFMYSVMHLNELVNNTIDWIICVAFQFFTNRTWVFDGKVDNTRDFVKQAASFTLGRLFTLVVEDVLLFIFITLLGFAQMPVKLAATFVVIALNYVISKLFVFKEK